MLCAKSFGSTKFSPSISQQRREERGEEGIKKNMKEDLRGSSDCRLDTHTAVLLGQKYFRGDDDVGSIFSPFFFCQNGRRCCAAAAGSRREGSSSRARGGGVGFGFGGGVLSFLLPSSSGNSKNNRESDTEREKEKESLAGERRIGKCRRLAFFFAVFRVWLPY